MHPTGSRPLLLLAAVAAGCGLRAYHYFRCPVVWHDEAALILNALRLPATALTGPLLYAEAAPPLFLAAEWAIARTLGDGVLALRLLPFLASVLAVVLFADLCRRTLPTHGAALAVGLFAVSDRLLWHACEAKPYALDVFAAVLAAWWFVRTEGVPLARRCVPLVALAPVVVWSSYPACFVLGGLVLGLAPAALRSGRTGQVTFLLAVGSLLAGFGLLVRGPVAAQRCEAMDSCWTAHFPDWSRPQTVPSWVVTQTFEVGRYCLLPLGQVCVVWAGLGAGVVWRRPNGPELVTVLVAPLGAALTAALLHQYPYGGMRVEAFAAPALCLLTGAGVAVYLSRLAVRYRWAAVLAGLTLLPPFALTAYRLVVPWPRIATEEAVRFVRAHRQPDEPIFGNLWEQEYYFRGDPGFRLWHGEFRSDEAQARRAWVVHADDPPPADYPMPLPHGWQAVRATVFERVTVFELRRRRPDLSPAAATP